MYCLSESDSYIQSYIDIYDLGIYGDIMQKVCTISQDKLMEALRDNIGLLLPKKNNQSLQDDYSITSIQPI